MKKRLSMLLILVLAVAMFTSIPSAAFAAETGYDSVNNYRTIYYGASGAIDMNIYNEDLFRSNGKVYDPQLAVMSIVLASTSCNSRKYSSEAEKYAIMPRNVIEFLEDHGFADVRANADYRVKPNGNRAPTVCAHKKITDNGKEYTLLAIVPKSGALEAEYNPVPVVSTKSGDDGDYACFVNLKNKTMAYVREYISDCGISGDVKVWIPGYSRGGGIVNLAAAEIIDDPEAALSSNISVADSDVYCYTISPYKSAVNTRDLKAERYDAIHHIVDKDDIVLRLPTETMCFDWYGQPHEMTDPAKKAEALRLLKVSSETSYEKYINGKDPDSFYPMKLDIAALLKGNLTMAKDEESYLPYEQDEFIDSVMDPIIEMLKEDGDTAREGYYRYYQATLSALISFFMTHETPDMATILKAKTAIPFVLSTYISFMADKYADNNNDRNAQLRAGINSTFNALAFNIEDENGDLKKEIAKLKATNDAYKMLRKLYFTENEAPEADANGIPQKYSLKNGIEIDQRFADAVLKLTGRLYALTISDVMQAMGADEYAISLVTSEEDCLAMAKLLPQFMYGNSRQSSRISPLDPSNEQFKNLATLIGNFKSCSTLHTVEYSMPWLQADCNLYEDYFGMTEAQLAGYRRLYIDSPEDTDVCGTIKDSKGMTAAVFENDRIISKNDEWIGFTKTDDGGWFRLPLDENYTVELTVSKDTKLYIKLAEYSVYDGQELRVVNKDSKYDWTGLKAYKNGTVSLNVPAAGTEEGGYELPSDAKYSIEVSGDSGTKPEPQHKIKYSSSIPKIKGVSVKAGSKSLTVSWKKLRAKQRAKFSRVQVQYSTSKSFKTYMSRNVSKSGKSCKIKGLKKGVKYYVRVRNVKKTSAVDYVSKWSAVKKVKVK